jgi:hypothetical protein
MGKLSQRDLLTVTVYMGPPSCRDCFYWQQDEDDAVDSGECHRYAPRPQAVSDRGEVLMADWPLTLASDSCGDFKCKGKQT